MYANGAYRDTSEAQLTFAVLQRNPSLGGGHLRRLDVAFEEVPTKLVGGPCKFVLNPIKVFVKCTPDGCFDC